MGTGCGKWTCRATTSTRSRGPQAHATEAAAGERQFQLTGHGDDNQAIDYRMFSGNPDYDDIRVMVVEALRKRGVPG